MKRKLVFLLPVLLMGSLSGCGKKETDSTLKDIPNLLNVSMPESTPAEGYSYSVGEKGIGIDYFVNEDAKTAKIRLIVENPLKDQIDYVYLFTSHNQRSIKYIYYEGKLTMSHTFDYYQEKVCSFIDIDFSVSDQRVRNSTVAVESIAFRRNGVVKAFRGNIDTCNRLSYKYHKHKLEQIAQDCALKSVANHKDKSVYYESCECGKIVSKDKTFSYGETVKHTFDRQIADDKYLAAPASCLTSAIYYYSCECGEKGFNTFSYGDPLGHAGTYKNDDNETYYKDGTESYICSRCHEKITRTITGSKLSNGSLKNLTYKTLENGTVEITGYKTYYNDSRDEKVAVPGTIDGKKVAGIGAHAFENVKNVELFNLDSSISYIGDYAFAGCTKLEGFALPEQLITLGNYAFKGCNALKGINCNKYLQKIGTYCFNGCDALSTIAFNENLIEIGDFAFAGCTKISRIILGNSVTKVGARSFMNCSGLESAWIGEGLISLGTSAFENCPKLSQVIFRGNAVTSISSKAFKDCVALESITIPTNVSYLGLSCFENCYKLSLVNLPSNITSISEKLFYNCESLSSITFTMKVTEIQDYAFANTGLTRVAFTGKVAFIYPYAYYGCQNLKKISFNPELSYISTYAFNSLPALEEVYIPSTVTTIQSKAFGGSPLAQIDVQTNYIPSNWATDWCGDITNINLGVNR